MAKLQADRDRTQAATGDVEAKLASVLADKQELETRFQEKLTEAATNRRDSEVRLKEAADRFARAEESISSLQEQLKGMLSTRADLEIKLAEVTGSVTEIQSARSGLETELNAASSVKTALEQQVQKLQRELQTARTHEAAAGAKAAPGVSAISSPKLDQEIARVEALLAEVMKLIDDPATALSTVMRKNVEKAELESYLRGIRFAAAPE